MLDTRRPPLVSACNMPTSAHPTLASRYALAVTIRPQTTLRGSRHKARSPHAGTGLPAIPRGLPHPLRQRPNGDRYRLLNARDLQWRRADAELLGEGQRSEDPR